ncbi:MAG: transcription termination/antitermination protein NusG [Hyphomicrobiaceae bacterium]
MSGTQLCWYVFRCRSTRELKAQSELEALGLKTLLPMGIKFRRARRRHKRRLKSQRIAYPLWTGYVIAGAQTLPWSDLRARFQDPAKSLTGIVVFDGVARPLSPALVEIIRHRTWGQVAPFAVGDTVEVVSGPFALRSGPVVEMSDAAATVLLEMLGRSVKVRFEQHLVSKAA